MHKKGQSKANYRIISQQSQLFLHVVFIHAIIMYLCSWYVEHAHATTEVRLRNNNFTAIKDLSKINLERIQ